MQARCRYRSHHSFYCNFAFIASVFLSLKDFFSKKAGKKDYEKVNKEKNNLEILDFIIYLIFTFHYQFYYVIYYKNS